VTSENRWSIEELLARYELEPELRDVFVEGTFDHDVLTQAYSNVSARPTFYEIDVVHVPKDLLVKYGLSLGNKQRIIALAREFGTLSNSARVMCLADRDLDHWFGDLEYAKRLRWTQFCCIENHFLIPEVVSDVLLTTARVRIKAIESFFISLKEVLKRLYALRLADRELGLGLTWVALRKYLSGKGEVLRLDDHKYMNAVASRNARMSRLNEFMTSYQKWLERLDGDHRLFARGHDYTELLAFAVAEFDGPKGFATAAAIERLFVLLARSVSTIPTELQ